MRDDAPQTPNPEPQILPFIVGPTGSGKTAVAIELCALLGGEIVSADSMQIYRGLDIGSAKPTREEQRHARHHLIDIREPHETYSAAQWAQDATIAIADIRARGLWPVIAGGTGFYLRALLHPESLADAAPDPHLRAQLQAEAATHGAGHLHARLSELDPDAAARLHPNDVRRVIRALEVALSPQAVSGQRLAVSGQRLAVSGQHTSHRSVVFGWEMPREQLYRRLDARVDVMLQAGFMDELRGLVEGGVPLSGTAMQGLGYKQMRPALEDPQRLDECVALWKRDTRRYAKRQMTWFRHQLPVQWIPVESDTPPAAIAARIARQWRGQVPDDES